MQFGTIVNRIKQIANDYQHKSDSELSDIALDLGFESRQTEQIDGLIERAFALVQVAGKRQLGMTHYDVQLLGGYTMCRGNVAEMRTGEGKTLTATLPMFVYALSGRGALLATSNDYLAKRDAEWMQPVYRSLGLSIGVIQSGMSREQRRAAYQCHLTYGTMKEFGFDFLRDHSGEREQQQSQLWFGDRGGGAESPNAKPVHREPHFILIDEADSILIDDARTPLIISTAQDESAQEQQKAIYRWSAQSAPKFREDEEYWYDREKRSVDLTPEGTALVRAIPKPPELAGVGLLEMYDFVERSIQVYRDYQRNREYVVREGEIVIVDESTGRISEGRRWSRGIHQAIEAKENVEITMDTNASAKITVQAFVSRFPYLGGMTGTALSSKKEFKKIYHMGVSVIPTNKPPKRIENPIKYFPTELDKFEEVVKDTLEIHKTGRPILIGTRSIGKSQVVSQLLSKYKVAHEVLNAKEIEREAEIIANAGKRGKITVATNMAGRGTDIKIGGDPEMAVDIHGEPDKAKIESIKSERADILSLGGMHVIGTEMHESSRIDQQLFGRCGRQGENGSVQMYISAEDKLLDSAFGKQKADAYRKSANSRTDTFWVKLFHKAQKKVENQHYRSRRILMYNEKMLAKSQREMGLDPILDNFD
ncbi:MAG: preprotein translocase subunit SecA [Planctomycetota bacterium]